MARYMNLMTDYAFKFVFGSEKHKNVVIKFLNSILEGKERIVDVTFQDKELLPVKEAGKRMVFDIYCTTDTGSHIIVEMQVRVPPTFVDRAIAYCSHAVLNQLRKGDGYSYEKVYGVFVMGSHLPHHKPRLTRKVSLIDEDTKEQFSDKINLIFLDLKCMNKKTFHECTNNIERYLFLVKNMENMKGKEKDYPMFDDLFDAADISDLAEEQYITYSQSRLKLRDDQEALEYEVAEESKKARKEGMAKGIAEGRAKGIAEGRAEANAKVARNLLEMGMEIHLISQATGMSIQEIEALI